MVNSCYSFEPTLNKSDYSSCLNCLVSMAIGVAMHQYIYTETNVRGYYLYKRAVHVLHVVDVMHAQFRYK